MHTLHHWSVTRFIQSLHVGASVAFKSLWLSLHCDVVEPHPTVSFVIAASMCCLRHNWTSCKATIMLPATDRHYSAHFFSPLSRLLSPIEVTLCPNGIASHLWQVWKHFIWTLKKLTHSFYLSPETVYIMTSGSLVVGSRAFHCIITYSINILILYL